jgi:hypothetical protein
VADNLVCWKCGASIKDFPYPLGRTVKCAKCKTDLHVCKLCKFYDTSKPNQCQEPIIADPIKDKSRANFCDYFQVKPDAHQIEDTTAIDGSKQTLAALFGDDVDPPNSDESADDSSDARFDTRSDNVKSELEKLFRDPGDVDNS